jgi:hypothetical protein
MLCELLRHSLNERNPLIYILIYIIPILCLHSLQKVLFSKSIKGMLRFSLSSIVEIMVSCGGKCERLIGTVFQLPSPDAIYSRDEEKKSMCGYPALFGLARGSHALSSRGEATRLAA